MRIALVASVMPLQRSSVGPNVGFGVRMAGAGVGSSVMVGLGEIVGPSCVGLGVGRVRGLLVGFGVWLGLGALVGLDCFVGLDTGGRVGRVGREGDGLEGDDGGEGGGGWGPLGDDGEDPPLPFPFPELLQLFELFDAFEAFPDFPLLHPFEPLLDLLRVRTSYKCDVSDANIEMFHPRDEVTM